MKSIYTSEYRCMLTSLRKAREAAGLTSSTGSRSRTSSTVERDLAP
jgi:hypothetical protein